MKKFILTLVIAFMMIFTANAQIATEKSNALDNINIGVTAGVSTPLDFNSVFPLNTNVGIKVGKNFTPVFGIQAEGIAFLNDNHFSDIKTAIKATNVGGNLVFNLSNIFGGYNGTPRVFEISTVTGLGWMHTWNTSNNFLTAKTGLDLAFNIGKKKAHSIVITPAVYWNLNKFGDIKFDKHGSQLAVNISYIYHFKTSNGTHHFKTYDVGAMLDEISRLNGALTECENREPKVIEKAVAIETPVIQQADTYVFFAYDSSELDDRAKEELNKIGQNGIYDIIAFASNEGSKEYNLALSQRRADAVKAYLENRGCKINSAVGKGVAFGLTTGRVAVVTAVH